MAVLVVLIVVAGAAGWLWWSGALDGLGDRVRDGLAVFYPTRPLSRRALPRKLLRAAARTVSVGVSGTALLPTRIEIAVNPADVEPFAQALDWLGHDVATALRKLAVAKGWMVPDGPRVVIVPDPERPLRMPRASGHIGALRPDDLRTLERTGAPPDQPDADGSGDGADARAAEPGWTGVQAGAVPTSYTGSAPTMAQGTPTGVPPARGSTGRTVPAAPAEAGRTAPTAPVGVGTLHLRLVSGNAAEEDLSAILTPIQAPLVLGRSRQCELRVRDRHASGRHCAFSVDPAEGALVVEDLGSTNGTFVGPNRIRRTKLRPGESLRIGDTSWRVELDGITTDESRALR